MKLIPISLAAAAFAALPLAMPLSVHADSTITYDNTNFGQDNGDSSYSSSDSSYPFVGQQDFVLNGMIRRVDIDHDRIVVFSDDNRRYNVDDYDADIRLDGADADTTDLHDGMRVRITGRLLGRTFLEADRLRVVNDQAEDADTEENSSQEDDSALPDQEAAPDNTFQNDAASSDLDEQQPSQDLMENAPSQNWPTVPDAPAVSGTPISLDALITQVGSDGRHLTILDNNDHALMVDTLGTDIIVPGVNSEGQFSDLARGMHVKLIGTQAADGSIQADRIRVQPAPAPPVEQTISQISPVVPNVPAGLDLSRYTGILIDASALPEIQRSPSPSLVSEDGTLLYPDRSDVPTPDEVQSESIVRYYRSLADAESGVAGPHPLILRAVAVIGNAHDGLELSPDDTALFQALDARLRYTHTWKVGFLIPEDR
jgi:hypothetical protein